MAHAVMWMVRYNVDSFNENMQWNLLSIQAMSYFVPEQNHV